MSLDLKVMPTQMTIEEIRCLKIFTIDMTGLDNEALESNPVQVSVAGRVMLQRIMGKASFITLQDMDGQIQAYIRSNDLPEGQYDDFKTWDLGDIAGISGRLFRTKTGELTVHADSVRLLTKSLRPLPEKHAGLVDTEQRYRKRYLDLLTNEDSLKVFKLRSQIISEIRSFFGNQDYLEVETPMMHSVLGGATAKPFYNSSQCPGHGPLSKNCS